MKAHLVKWYQLKSINFAVNDGQFDFKFTANCATFHQDTSSFQNKNEIKRKEKLIQLMAANQWTVAAGHGIAVAA